MKESISIITQMARSVIAQSGRLSTTTNNKPRGRFSAGTMHLASLLVLLALMLGIGQGSYAAVHFSQNYDMGEVTADWTSAITDRYTVSIAGDETNHYLQVSPVGNGNNGTTITSTSLSNVLPADAVEFTLSFDLQLSPGNNKQSTFEVYDGGNSGRVLKLFSTAPSSQEWQINNSTQTITLDKTKWFSFTVDVIDKLVYLTVTDRETGTVVFTRQKINSLVETFGLSKMVFSTARYSAGMAIDNVIVKGRAVIKDWDFTKCTAGTPEYYADNSIKTGRLFRWEGSYHSDRLAYLCKSSELEGLYIDSDGPWKILSNNRGLYLEKKGDRVIGFNNLFEDDIILIKLHDTQILSGYDSKILDASNASLINKDYSYILTVTSDGIVGVNLEKYSSIDRIVIVREDKPVNISYSKGNDDAVVGEAPEGQIVQKNTPFATPVNELLYKDGYTLTGWLSQAGDTTKVGGYTTVTGADVFTPVFTRNAVGRDEATDIVTTTFTDVTWTESGTEKYYITQSLFKSRRVKDGESQDMALKVDGKTFTLYNIIKGTKIAVPTGTVANYSAANTTTTANGDTLVYNGTANTLTVTYSGSAATIDEIKLLFPLTNNPILSTDLSSVYAVGKNSTYVLTPVYQNVSGSAMSYKWYECNANGEEGSIISGATSSTFTVPSSVIGTKYYYCEATNAYGTTKTSVARVVVADYVTFDFKNWPAADKEMGFESFAKGGAGIIQGSIDGGAYGKEWDVFPVLYPYDMAGYFGVFSDLEILPGTGMKRLGTNKGDRPLLVYDTEVGDVIVLEGKNLKASDVVPVKVESNNLTSEREDRAGAEIFVNEEGTKLVALITKKGHFTYMFLRTDKNDVPYNVVEKLMVVNKHKPTLTTDLTAQSHTINREETETLTVAATTDNGNGIRYQWFRALNDTLRGGTPIEGATSATFTTPKNQSYYYYCVAYNDVTGAAVVTSNTAHVECNPMFSYEINDEDAIGETPAPEEITIGEKFTVEKRNDLLYKKGYTLTGWTDGSKSNIGVLLQTHEYGESYDIVNDVKVYPFFVENKQPIKDLIKNTTITWQLGTEGTDGTDGAGAVKWEDDKVHPIVVQQEWNREVQDFALLVSSTSYDNKTTPGKYAHVAAGTKITLPVKYGSKITVKVKEGEPDVTFHAEDFVANPEREFEQDGNVLTYTYGGALYEGVLTLPAGDYESISVTYEPGGLPIILNQMDDAYHAPVNETLTLTIDGTENCEYQWYKNTTLSNVGGTKLLGQTSKTLNLTSSKDVVEYYYYTIKNDFGVVTSEPTTVEFNSYITLDFRNWDEDDAKEQKDSYVSRVSLDSSNKTQIESFTMYDFIENDVTDMRGGLATYAYIYPYALAGYFNVQAWEDINRITPGQGYHNYGSGGRILYIKNMHKGERIQMLGDPGFVDATLLEWNAKGMKGSAATDSVRHAGTYNYDLNEAKDRLDITMTSDGTMMLYLIRYLNVYEMVLPNRYAPVITKDLEKSYVVAKNESLKLTVEANLPVQKEGMSVGYQWYVNNKASNKGGWVIEGANKSSYTIAKVDSAATYYCLVYNTETKRITPSTPATVGFYVDVKYTNPDNVPGVVPDSVKVQTGLSVTIPKNQTLYKKGYTLESWLDSKRGVDTEPGGEYIPDDNVGLIPEFKANADGISLQKRSEEFTSTWQFGQSNGAAKYDGKASANVNQVQIKGIPMDLGILMTAGAKNEGDDQNYKNGWLSAGNATFTVPVVKRAIVRVKVKNTTPVTINGTEIPYTQDKGAEGDVLYEYTYNGDADEIPLTVGDNYISYIEVYYPNPHTLTANPSSRVDLVIRTAKTSRRTATITLTGSHLPLSTQVEVVKGANSDAITVLPSEAIMTNEDGSLSQDVVLEYNSSTLQDSVATKITFSCGEATVDVPISYGRKVAVATPSELTAIEGKTVWDWANSTVSIGTDNNKIEQNAYTVFQDVVLTGEETWPAKISDKVNTLAGAGDFFVNTNVNAFQGTTLCFDTDVAGTVTVVYSNVGSTDTRTITVNGVASTKTSKGTAKVTSDDIRVNPGLVTISGMLSGQGQNISGKTVYIYNVTFTPYAEKPVIVLDNVKPRFKLTSSKAEETKDLADDNETKEVIRYTLDGSEPTEQSELYKYGEWIPLYTNKTIKARAFCLSRNASDVAVTLPEYPTRVLTVTANPDTRGYVTIDPEVENNLYTVGSEVTLTARAFNNYGLKGWSTSKINSDNNVFITGATDVSYKATIGLGDTENQYWAAFGTGSKGTTVYDIANAVVYDYNGDPVVDEVGGIQHLTQVRDSLVSMNEVQCTAFKSRVENTGSISVPSTYPLTTSIFLNGCPYTLTGWVDGNDKEYILGTNYLYSTSNEVVTLRPVYKRNKFATFLETRESKFEATWHLNRDFGAHPITVAGNKEFILNTHTTMSYYDASGTLCTNQEVDVPLEVSTGDDSSIAKAFTNEDLDGWCTIRENTKLTVPAAYGAKIYLTTYEKIKPVSEGGTGVNGNNPDNLYDENLKKDENGVYTYYWTIKDNVEEATLTIGVEDHSYYQSLKLEMPSATKVYMDYDTNDAVRGSVKGRSAKNEQPVYVDPLGYEFDNGAEVTLTAKRNKYYELAYWEDGNGYKIYPNGYWSEPGVENNEPVDIMSSTTISGDGSMINSVLFKSVSAEQSDSTYTLSLVLRRAYKLTAHFKEKTSYEINFSSGDGEGVTFPQQHVEDGESFTMPANNYNLYKAGYTLTHYEAQDEGNTTKYEFGKTYTTNKNLRLVPVFVANQKTIAEITNDVTVKWPLSSIGKYAYDAKLDVDASRGIVVAQAKIDNDNTIDMLMRIESRTTGCRVYTDGGLCHVVRTSGASPELILYPTAGSDVIIKPKAGDQYDGGNIIICGDKNLVGGTTETPLLTKNITAEYLGSTKDSVHVLFGKSLDIDELSIVYKPIESAAELSKVTINGVTLNETELSAFKTSRAITKDIPAADIVNNKDVIPNLFAEATNGTTSVTQATLDNHTATIYLKTEGGITVKSYTVTYNITGKTAPTLDSLFVNSTKIANGATVAAAQSVSGVVTLWFNHAMTASNINNTNLGDLTAAVDGRKVTLTYWHLEDNKQYTLNLPANTFTDAYGMSCATPISVTFSTAKTNVTKNYFSFVVSHKLKEEYDYRHQKVVGDTLQILSDEVLNNLKEIGVPYGTLEEALDAANNDKGTERFRIFIPDGVYNMRGNDEGKLKSISVNAYVKDSVDSHTFTQGTVKIREFGDVYYNGRTILTRSNVSIIGQSLGGTVIYNNPIIEGVEESPTLKIKDGITDTYLQDLTLENRFCSDQGNQPNAMAYKDWAHGAPAFYDNGVHTVMKQVAVKAHEASINSSVAQTDSYYEDCQLWGAYFFLHGNGQTYWRNPTIVLRNRENGNQLLYSDHTVANQKWGHVFEGGQVITEPGYTIAENRAWGYGGPKRNSPAMTFLQTRYCAPINPVGYSLATSTGFVSRMHEYQTRDSQGNLLDLTKRTTAIFNPAAGSEDCVLSDEQAREYTLYNVLGGTTGYDPSVYTAQIDLDDETPKLSTNDDAASQISWTGSDAALCYFIFRIDEETGDTVFYNITKDNFYVPDAKLCDGATFVIRAANERGGLGKPSEAILFKTLKDYTVIVTEVGPVQGRGWATVCLPYNATFKNTKETEGTEGTEETEGTDRLKVYAAIQVNGTTLALKEVTSEMGLAANRGYVISAPVGSYKFYGTYSSVTPVYDEIYSLLDGNPNDTEESVGSRTIYTLAYKPLIFSGNVGFYQYSKDKIPPHKAFLETNSLVASGFQIGAKGLIFKFIDEEEWEEDETGIEELNEQSADGSDAIFDLAGRRIEKSQMRRGQIYIIGGKKIVY